MNREKNKLSANILYRMLGILLVLAVIAAWLVSGTYAKYIMSKSFGDTASVEGASLITVEIWEHGHERKDGMFFLEDGDSTGVDNVEEGESYHAILPGVDIPKDLFIKIEKSNDEDVLGEYYLYVKVTEGTDYPYKVSGLEKTRLLEYPLTASWMECADLCDEENGIYVYQFVDSDKEPIIIDKNYLTGEYTDKYSDDGIQILKDNKLIVSEGYRGEGQFTLTFEAYLVQKLS